MGVAVDAEGGRRRSIFLVGVEQVSWSQRHRSPKLRRFCGPQDSVGKEQGSVRIILSPAHHRSGEFFMSDFVATASAAFGAALGRKVIAVNRAREEV